jgi:hypothetical protein
VIQAEAASSVGSALVGCSGTTITGRRDDGRLLAHYGLQPRPGSSPLVDGELMSERQNLDLHGKPGPKQTMDERRGGA